MRPIVIRTRLPVKQADARDVSGVLPIGLLTARSLM